MGVFLIKLSILFFVANHLVLTCEGLQTNSARSYNSGKYDKSYKEPSQPKTYTGTSSSPPGRTIRRGLGISAWGIVIVVLSMIFVGMGVYYFSICYPIICKRQSKYDMIELANV